MYGETDILLVNYSNGYYLFSGQLIKELEAFRPEELYKAEDDIYTSVIEYSSVMVK